MPKFKYIVTVETDTQIQADQVINERLECDEDYGFEYRITGTMSTGISIEGQSPTDEQIDAIASELALIDRYDPNQFTPLGWRSVKEGYEAKARRVLEAMNGN